MLKMIDSFHLVSGVFFSDELQTDANRCQRRIPEELLSDGVEEGMTTS